MAGRTAISWADMSWNPIRGCTIKSLGCQHCYAMAQAGRFSGTGQPYEGLVRKTSQGFRWTGDVRLIEKDLAVPLRWKKPRRIFVTSMSDLFHENVEDEWLDRIFAVMALAPRHTFQALTKRPERMYSYLHPGKCASSWRDNLALAAFNLFGQEAECAVANAIEGCLADGFNVGWPLSNLWLGVSVENQATADERIPWLLKTPATVRFVSYEPALAPVDFTNICTQDGYLSALTGLYASKDASEEHISWLICGGESGPRARLCEIDWLRAVVQQCTMADVAVWCKQLGSHPGGWSGLARMRDRKGADIEEFPVDLRIQQFPQSQHAGVMS